LIDSNNQEVQNCFYINNEHDLVVEFLSRNEGVHKIYIYLNGELIDNRPYTINVNHDTFGLSSNSSCNIKNDIVHLNDHFYSSSSKEMSGSYSEQSATLSNTDSTILFNNPILNSNNNVLLAKKNQAFHYVVGLHKIQGLCILSNFYHLNYCYFYSKF
jgi:hypothetical protein